MTDKELIARYEAMLIDANKRVPAVKALQQEIAAKDKTIDRLLNDIQYLKNGSWRMRFVLFLKSKIDAYVDARE
jgi:hypothetical protein